MMPTIRVDDEVMAAISKEVQRPFKDTPNDVLRRKYNLPERPTLRASERPTRERGKLLPMSMYRRPILDVLHRRGGKARVATVLKLVGDMVRGVLTPLDLRPIKSGAVRWENRVMWERLNMVKEGLLRDNSPRGVWEITAAGQEYLKTGKVDEAAEFRRQRNSRLYRQAVERKMKEQSEEPVED